MLEFHTIVLLFIKTKMVARVAGVFDEKLTEAIANSKILVVGAGGIGCEILKNLVLTGFPNIEIVCTSYVFKLN